MTSTNFFDVITVGSDMAGLLASALLARRGFRVLLIDHEAPPEKLVVAGCEVPRGPLRITGLESIAFRRVVAELNLVQILRRRVEPLRPAFQAALPEHRLDAYSDPEAFARELARELPEAREAIDAVCARAAEVSQVLEPVLGQDINLPPDSFWERREIARYAMKLPRPDEDVLAALPKLARALCAAPALFSSALDPGKPGPVPLLRSLDLWRHSVSRIDGGLAALRALLVERLRTHAGDILRADVETIELKRSKVAGVKLVGKSDVIGANYVIAALPAARLSRLLETPPKRLASATAALRPAARRYVLDLVVAQTGIPEGMAPHVISVRDPDAPLLGANALSLTLEGPDEEGRVVVCCDCAVPVDAEGDGDGELSPRDLETTRAGVLAHVRELMPFVDAHIMGMYSPTEGLAASESQKNILPIVGEPIYRGGEGAALGIGGIPHDVGIKHLVTASRENLPGLGLEGDMVTAWSVARVLCHAARKKDYLKDAVLPSG